MTNGSNASSNTFTEGPTHRSPGKTQRPNYFNIVFSRALLTTEVVNYDYNGSGTEDDPFVVEFIPNDPRDPMGFSFFTKWAITLLVALATLAVAFVSSAYTGGVNQIIETFGVSDEIVVLGISLFVLGASYSIPNLQLGARLTWWNSSQSGLCFGLLYRKRMAGS